MNHDLARQLHRELNIPVAYEALDAASIQTLHRAAEAANAARASLEAYPFPAKPAHPSIHRTPCGTQDERGAVFNYADFDERR